MPQQGDPVTDQQPQTDPQTPEPKVSVTPVSIMTCGPLNVLILRRTVDESSEFLMSVRRVVTSPNDDPNMIPIMEVPALIRMLEEAFTPSLSIRSLLPPQQPQQAPSAPAPKTKKGKRK